MTGATRKDYLRSALHSWYEEGEEELEEGVSPVDDIGNDALLYSRN